MDPKPFVILRREWRALAESPRSTQVGSLLADREKAIAALAPLDLADLVDHLGCAPRSEGSAPHVATVRALVHSFDLDPLVGLTALELLRPGLIGLGRRFRWGYGTALWPDPDTFAGDLIVAAWEVLEQRAGRHLPFPIRNVLEAVRGRMRKMHDGEARRRARQRSIEALAAGSGAAAPARRAVEELAELIEGARGGALSDQQASLLYANRVLGLELPEIAALTGRSVGWLRYRRQLALSAIGA